MMQPEPMPPAVRRLLELAYETIAQANELRAQGRHADALSCALFANEYVRTAKAIAGMEEANAEQRNELVGAPR